MIKTQEFVIFSKIPSSNVVFYPEIGGPNYLVLCDVVKHTTGTVISIEPVTDYINYDFFINSLKADDEFNFNGYKFKITNSHGQMVEARSYDPNLYSCDLSDFKLNQVYTIKYSKNNNNLKTDIVLNAVNKEQLIAVTVKLTLTDKIDFEELK